MTPRPVRCAAARSPDLVVYGTLLVSGLTIAGFWIIEGALALLPLIAEAGR